ncbi:MAG: EpsG family protein [Lachnospiraceae bacterium]|nr:EpsG family protein [Lachnospiraceae bacterium]
MAVYLMLTVLTIGLASLTVHNAPAHSRALALNRTVICAIFVLLFAVSALRYRVGNDYWWYTEIMHEISVLHHPGAMRIVPTEPLFNGIVWLIYNLSGTDNYLLAFAVMSFLTAAGFLYVIYRQSNNFFLSYTMFLLLCFYFQSFSTVRYYAALPLALMALPHALRGDWPRFALLVLTGGLLHKTLFAVFLLYPLARIRWNKILIAAGAALGAFCILFPDVVMRAGLLVYPTWEQAGKAAMQGSFSLLNVLRCALVLLFVAWNARNNRDILADESVRMQTKMTFMALVMYLVLWFVPQLSRLTYYLIVPQILLVPRVLMYVEDRREKRIQTALVIGACALYFCRYMLHAAEDGIRVLPYASFLFSFTH